MRLQHQVDIVEKDSQINKMQTIIDKLRDISQKKEFIKETLEINSLLSQQQHVFYQKISLINPYCEISDALTNQVVDKRL